MKWKSVRYQLTIDILLKRNFDSHLWKQYIQSNDIRDKDAIEHPSKSSKLNGVGKIFLDLFNLYKYTLITTIHFMTDDVEASQSFQTNGSKIMGVSYFLTSKLNSKHSIDYFLLNMPKTIVKHNEDWHERVTYQTILGTFSFSLVCGKKLRFSQNIYLLSLLLDQLSPRQSLSIQS